MTAPPEFDDRTRWEVLPLGVERLITGSEDQLTLSAPPTHQSRPGASDNQSDTVFYGWPLVVVRQDSRADRSSTVRCAPLLIVEVQATDSDPRQLKAVGEPGLNPGLLVEDFFEPDAIAAVRDMESDGLQFGDPAGLSRQIELICEALGMPTPGLDPGHLTPHSVRRVPGIYHAAAVFRTRVDVANAGLLDDLAQMENREDWQHTAARHLLQPIEPVDVAPQLVPAALVLNDSQEQALIATVTAPVTVITGPPGTGKSQLVAAIVASAWLRAESVLVASTNNHAVEVAVERAAAIDAGLLIRTGNRTYREKLPDLLRRLALRPAPESTSIHVTQRRLAVAADTRRSLLAALERQSRAESELAGLTRDLEAQRSLLWGSPAPSPVHDRCRSLGHQAQRLVAARWFVERRSRSLLVNALVPAHRRVSVGDLAAWATKQARWDEVHRQVLGVEATTFTDEFELMEAADAEWRDTSIAVIGQVVSARLAKGRAALEQFSGIRTGGRAARQAALARTLPTASGWACTALSASANFPLNPGLFDLLIIDEASQCRVADVLPLAYRAKRIVVVGDPNQLTPVVKLGKRTMETAARAVGTTDDALHDRAVSFGRDSAFTAFAAHAGLDPFLLDEHYRCHPDIASFINAQFYNGRLRVLTDVAELAGTLRGVQWQHVAGRTERGPKGGALNRVEAEAVVRWIVEHSDEAGSVGVVTPFAAQSALIERLLADVFDADACRNVMVGTAHRFQGGERDVMVFSPVLSVGARARTATWVQEHRNLVNVAVSRARRALLVIGDENAGARLEVPILVSLHAATLKVPTSAPAVDSREDPSLHSESERRLYEALRRMNLTVELKPVVEGFELDFAVGDGSGRWVNVECDGSHHNDVRGRQRRQDVKRDMVLQRLGWTVTRIPSWRCLSEPDTVAGEIRREVDELPAAETTYFNRS